MQCTHKQLAPQGTVLAFHIVLLWTFQRPSCKRKSFIFLTLNLLNNALACNFSGHTGFSRVQMLLPCVYDIE